MHDTTDVMLAAWDAWILWCLEAGVGQQDLMCPHPFHALWDGFLYRGHHLNVCPYCREQFRKRCECDAAALTTLLGEKESDG